MERTYRGTGFAAALHLDGTDVPRWAAYRIRLSEERVLTLVLGETGEPLLARLDERFELAEATSLHSLYQLVPGRSGITLYDLDVSTPRERGEKAMRDAA